MNLYIEKPRSYLLENADPDGEMLMEQLYLLYKELHPVDTEQIKAGFAKLDGILGKLPLKDYDSIWMLCAGCAASMKARRSGMGSGPAYS